MSKLQKLLIRLLARPKDFTWGELVSLLEGLGYTKVSNRGSRYKFNCEERESLINLHRPHPTPILKSYVVDQVIEKLKGAGFCDE